MGFQRSRDAAELDEQLFLGCKVELEALQSLGFDFLSLNERWARGSDWI